MKELFDNCLKNLALLGVWNREDFLEVFGVINEMYLGSYHTFDEIDYTNPAYPDMYVVTEVVVFNENNNEIATIKVKHV